MNASGPINTRISNADINELSATVVACNSLGCSTASARLHLRCPFSESTEGDHSVPAPGCKLSQLVTVSAGATMNVSGVAEANPLHTLAAVAGDVRLQARAVSAGTDFIPSVSGLRNPFASPLRTVKEGD